MIRVVLVIAIGTAATAAGLLALLWFGQRGLIYFPDRAAPPAVESWRPAAREVRFETDDQLTLAAWWVPAEAPASGATVIVVPGNAGNRAGRLPLAEGLARRGFSVLLTDYRGYGGNPGSPSEAGLQTDARAARRWLATQPGVDADRLVYYGESLGTGVAVALAAETPPALLVLRSPFTSMADVASEHYPFLPVRLLLRDRFDSSPKIARIGAPLLVIAGEEDRIVPFSQSRALFESAREPKRLLLVPGAGHNDMALLAGERPLDAIADAWRAWFREESR